MAKKDLKEYSVVIIGAGPAGLCFAKSLSSENVKIAIIEKSDEKILKNPPIDGRDIAITHLTYKSLNDLEIWDNIPADQVADLKGAKVQNGGEPYCIDFDHEDAGTERLGYMVPNHLIRKAAYETVKKLKNIDIITGVSADKLEIDGKAQVTLSDGNILNADLIVAADSRFSGIRRKIGIPTAMTDFGRTVIVCEMKNELEHDGIAFERFNYGETLAVLPLADKKSSSIVITLSSDKADRFLNMPNKEFNEYVEDRFDHQLGKMELVGDKHPYPLVATYASKFYADRLALIGDAAVGMHPVTAHGFNLGVRSAITLTAEIKKYLDLGLDIGSSTMLKKYHRKHRRVTRPLYLGTNMIVKLYTSETKKAKMVRKLMLHLGNGIKPVKKMIMNQLTETNNKPII